MACKNLKIPVHVLVRPRAGDFVFDDAECDVVQSDIEACKSLGCSGVAVGALTAEGDIDTPRCRAWVAAARGMSVTFHRAFDLAREPTRALEEVIALGCERLLTSGQAAGALAGAALIRQLIEQARGRIMVMAGAGITAQNIAAVAVATGAHEFHASAKVRAGTRLRQAHPAPPGLEGGHWQTDAGEVRACIDALRALASSAHPPRRNPSR